MFIVLVADATWIQRVANGMLSTAFCATRRAYRLSLVHLVFLLCIYIVCILVCVDFVFISYLQLSIDIICYTVL